MNRWQHYLHWILPGFDVKRWVTLTFLGGLCVLLGAALALNLQPVTWLIEQLRWLAQHIPSQYSGPGLMLAGMLAVTIGTRKMRSAVQTIMGQEAWLSSALEQLYRRHKLDRGPRIVAIGGGTGLSTLLRGLKSYTNNLTAVVTVGDDGGSSGRLRQEQNIIPPGDIRNCIAALADEERLLTELFQYRFKNGQGLSGHSFGNLFLTAMCQVTGDMVTAIKESSKVLSIRGRVLPSTLDMVSLVAEMEDGTVVHGESLIPLQRGTIRHLSCIPDRPVALPEAVEAIRTAELIILGPGSLYTSVLPNLLIEPIRQAIVESKAPRIYVCNAMTQPGETDGYTVSQHIEALLSHTHQRHLLDAVLVNLDLPQALLDKYRTAGCEPVELDRDAVDALGVEVVEQPLMNAEETHTIRHDHKRLARAVIRWFKAYQKRFPQRRRDWRHIMRMNPPLQPALATQLRHTAQQVTVTELADPTPPPSVVAPATPPTSPAQVTAL